MYMSMRLRDMLISEKPRGTYVDQSQQVLRVVSYTCSTLSTMLLLQMLLVMRAFSWYRKTFVSCCIVL